jgi:formate dehydrogenase gamma subunit
VRLGVDASILTRSAHKDLGCVDCHVGLDPGNVPHAPRIPAINCMACHSDAPAAHAFHPQMSSATGTDGAPGISCKGCHGTHDVVSPKVPGSRFHPASLAAACARCHDEVAKHYLDSAHGKALTQGIAVAPNCLNCHARPITDSRSGAGSVEHKITQERMCLSCHLNDEAVRKRMVPTAGFIAAFEASVHGAALQKGNAAAATCVDCHGSHEMKKGFDQSSRVSKTHVPATCGACHADIARQYDVSVHARAVGNGNTAAPVCTDCHGEHNILKTHNPRSPVAAANLATQVCSPCHSSVRLSQKYGIPTDRLSSFEDSYHGLALQGGAVEVANCASCHGAHDIRPASDPESSVNKANLLRTCGRCHPGANKRFAVGQVHIVLAGGKEPLLYWIATLYVTLIVTVVGSMVAHNAVDFVRKSRRRLRARRAEEDEEPVARGLYLRMTLSERLQHGTLVASFTILAVTGFMLHYPEAWWVVALRRLSLHLFELRGILHRVAGVVLVLASLYHAAHMIFTVRGRDFFRDMLPRRMDVTDALRVLAYNLGLARGKPRFGRFSYVEKSEYWALVWGTMVMALTGVILWFENTFMGLLTKLGWDVARTIHFYEAWLATLAILVWHIYYVIFNPDVYPMNLAWLTGTITAEEMHEEHPLELEAIRRRDLEQALAAQAAGPDSPPETAAGFTSKSSGGQGDR